MFPGPPFGSMFTVNTSVLSENLNVLNEYGGGIFQVPGNFSDIKEVGLWTGANSKSGGTLEFVMAGVNTSNGRPSGSDIWTGSSGVISSITADTVNWAALTTAGGVDEGDVSVGDWVYAGAKVTSAYSSGSTTINLAQAGNFAAYGSISGAPYTYKGKAGGLGDDWPILGFKNSSGVIIPVRGLSIFDGVSEGEFRSSDTYEIQGMAFQFPVPLSVCGIVLMVSDKDQEFAAQLYDSDGFTILRGGTSTSDPAAGFLDSDIRATQGAEAMVIPFAPYTITANTIYRVALQAQNNTNRTYFMNIECPSTAEMASLPGNGNMYLTQHNGVPSDPASWNDVTTSFPTIGLLIDGLDDGAGGGGSSGRRLINGGLIH